MANKYRGEIAAELGGQPYRLCLTLGALAELEAAFESSDLVALVKRFETGHLAARDLIRILGAGLRGAGHDISDLQLSQLPHPGGVQAMSRLQPICWLQHLAHKLLPERCHPRTSPQTRRCRRAPENHGGFPR